MKILLVALLLTACASQKTATPPAPPPVFQLSPDPSQLYPGLFERVQKERLYSDSKTFVDMVPREAITKIQVEFSRSNLRTTPQLRAFVEQHFFPIPADAKQKNDHAKIDDHIKRLWQVLRRDPDKDTGSSLIPLPHAYVVPGGRFREIYYWDSYFTQLGLLADGEQELFRSMVKNFGHLLNIAGRIPNGNRTYYLGRSQPPFFSYMVSLWREKFGAPSAAQFLPALRLEHDFWMAGVPQDGAAERVVRVEGGLLNRDWDDRIDPRPEAYREDVALAKESGRPPAEIYRDLRATAETGWDFSTRWFADPARFSTVQTTSLVPVDLNSLLHHLETEIATLARSAGDTATAGRFDSLANARRALVQKYMWDEESGTFRDWNWRTKQRSPELTLATVVPLFAGIATKEQAARVADVLRKQFLKPGGLVTTLRTSGQQWDSPNGWPPLQWMAYAGLKRYGQDKLGEEIRTRWLKLNRRVYQSTGKMMEKYNVVNVKLKSGGGEYPAQDGFGWTNGVFRAFETPVASLKHLEN